MYHHEPKPYVLIKNAPPPKLNDAEELRKAVVAVEAALTQVIRDLSTRIENVEERMSQIEDNHRLYMARLDQMTLAIGSPKPALSHPEFMGDEIMCLAEKSSPIPLTELARKSKKR